MSVRDDVLAVTRWFAQHAPPLRAKIGPGATPAAIVELSFELQVTLPEDFVEYLEACGGTLSFFEYSGLKPEQILRVRRGLEQSRQERSLGEVPRDEHGSIFQAVRWSPGWIPFAEDGGGNLFLIDLAPGPHGQRGQVLQWERAEGPGCVAVRSFGQYLARYRELLLAGGYTFDADSYTFDGWNDDERP